jgi:peptidyl-prolyl cis-trans isomerase C
MIRRGMAAAGLLLVLFVGGCASTRNGAALNEPAVGDVAFRLDGRSFSVTEVTGEWERVIAPGVAQALASGQTREEIEAIVVDNDVRNQVFDQLIQDELLLAWAKQAGLTVDSAQLEEQVAAQVGADPTVDEEQVRLAAARDQLILQSLALNTRTEMARARHILVADQAAAEQVLAALAAGEDFGTLAAARSTDTISGQNGGDLGWAARGEFVAPFEEAVFTAALNTPVIVQSEFGFHVIEVLEREANRSFESFEVLSRATNAGQFYEASFVPWYSALRAEAEQAGRLELAPGFDPNSLAIPFPAAP